MQLYPIKFSEQGKAVGAEVIPDVRRRLASAEVPLVRGAINSVC